ncbi:MAG: glycosyltransferase [Deltaproteobacteria bacterium]|nr:glycosyltransferase [Deltaproteobacteria bacterium]
MTGATPWERDLGGSESAMVFVARALAARGHDVQVFTLCDRAGEYDGVRYDTLEALDAQARVRDWDVFVSLRFPDLLLRDVRAAVRVLWCQDVLDHHPVEAWLAACDRIVVVSEWHRERTLRHAPGIGERLSVIRNPVALDLVPADEGKPRAPVLLHLSRPERGLDALLAAWPSIRARVPEARLGVARYRSFHEPRGSQIEALCQDMDRRVAATPGAFLLGHLHKPALYEQLSVASLMVYPAEFDETSCIAAIEAQACGCPVVAARRGALPETLAPGAAALVEPGPGMRARFADAVVELMFDPRARASMSARGRERARLHDTRAVAEEWEQSFRDSLVERLAVAPSGPTAAAWPAPGDRFWDAVVSRLVGTVRVIGHHPDLPDPAPELTRRGVVVVAESEGTVLDWGGLLLATDPVEWLHGITGARVLSVLPWAKGVSAANIPTPAAVASWFDGAEEHGLTAEATSENGTPARCWLVAWTPGQLRPSRPAANFARPTPRVTVCMIVRDAADTLRTALASLLPIADEYRILDTGSEDGTIGVAQSFARDTGARVVIEKETWPGDFAVARNRSIRDAEGDWIVWLDADERLVGAERLRRYVQSAHFNAFAIRQHNQIFDRGHTQVEIPFRALRNGMGYRFYGAVHEHPERALNQPIEPWTMAEGVDILHTGYLTEAGRVRKLLGRNLRLLNLDFERYPGRLLSDVLYLRDCVNLAWFDQRDHGQLRPDHVHALRAALHRFEEVHMPERGRYYHMGRKYYDHGLALLGEGVESRVRVGGGDADERQHRVRRPDDAVWLAGSAARDHFFKHLGPA